MSQIVNFPRKRRWQFTPHDAISVVIGFIICFGVTGNVNIVVLNWHLIIDKICLGQNVRALAFIDVNVRSDVGNQGSSVPQVLQVLEYAQQLIPDVRR
jgi:hypothetical protein